MGDKIFEFISKPRVYLSIAFAFLVLLGVTGWGIYQTQVPPEQPLDFPHDLHVNLGVQCLYCHPGAWKQASAGLPSNAKCWGCHQQLSKYADPATPWPARLQVLKDYVERNEPIPWVPVAIVPDFVHFNHRPHVAAGLNCENCHGNIAAMTVAENPQVMNMGWCLNCHNARSEDNPELRKKLIDCGTCHY